MTELMQKALNRFSELPESDQEAVAARLLAEIEDLPDERLWAEKFAKTHDLLARMADEARKKIADGKTYPLEDIL